MYVLIEEEEVGGDGSETQSVTFVERGGMLAIDDGGINLFAKQPGNLFRWNLSHASASLSS